MYKYGTDYYFGGGLVFSHHFCPFVLVLDENLAFQKHVRYQQDCKNSEAHYFSVDEIKGSIGNNYIYAASSAYINTVREH